MRLESIMHRSAFTDCYAVDKEEIVICIRTGKDVTGVNIIHDDPYMAGISAGHPWSGQVSPMELDKELKYCFIWSIKLKPRYKREQYYFEIFAGTEKIYRMEDDFYSEQELNTPGRMKQYFKFPWLNPSDVFAPPSWAEQTIWYQIMPDRFCRGDYREKSVALKPWNRKGTITHRDFFGGDLKGIMDKLPYLRDLGITGIYLTPVFKSTSNHKYNTTDYTQIDPDFGDETDMKNLIKQAHDSGIKIMLDAVFNHCGNEFFPWQDVLEKGKSSRYYDWFFINKLPLGDNNKKTKDGRYYTFAFEAYMPKLNTNHPEVVKYFTDICRYWVKEWNIDGIRFDVGNEIAHSFLKRLRYELKQLNPEIFLLGEIWHDSIQWLLGDEYDSVMNYPFVESLNNFWIDKEMNAKDFMYGINRCYSLYPEQVNRVLFNFLDSHDVGRAYTRCGSLDVFFQQLAVLMTMPGSPCLYYGTELAMPGGNDPDNRRCMPWKEIAAGQYDDIIEAVQKLITLRKNYPQMRSSKIIWKHDTDNLRLVHYQKLEEDCGNVMEVFLNASLEDVRVEQKGDILFARNYKNGCLEQNGSLILQRKQSI